MRRLLLLFISIFAMSVIIRAQDSQSGVFRKGTCVVSAGASATYWSFSGRLGSTLFPLCNVMADYSIISNLLDGQASVGIGSVAGLGFRNLQDKVSILGLFGPRATFHYQFAEELDAYLFSTFSYSFLGRLGRPIFDFGLGTRYYLNPKLAISIELGVGFPAFVGLSIPI